MKAENNNNKIRFKRLHDWLVRIATNEKYWGRLSANEINSEKRTIYFGFYAIGYHLLDPQPKIAIALLAWLYKYRMTQSVIEFHTFGDRY